MTPREFEWLYDNYGDAIYGIIRRIISDEEIAREALQDVFLKIWNYRDKYDHKVARVFTWMSRIARNHSLNVIALKSNKNQQKNQSLDAAVYCLGERKSYQMDGIDLIEVIAQIDPKYKCVIEYAYFKGYTQKEISEELDMPLGSVKSAIKIGLRELKKIYDYGGSKSEAVLLLLMYLNS